MKAQLLGYLRSLIGKNTQQQVHRGQVDSQVLESIFFRGLIAVLVVTSVFLVIYFSGKLIADNYKISEGNPRQLESKSELEPEKDILTPLRKRDLFELEQ